MRQFWLLSSFLLGFGLGLGLLAAAPSAAPAKPETAASNNSRASDQTAERLIAERIQAMRAQYAPSARPLRVDPELSRIAEQRSRAMANGGPFAHEDFLGRIPAVDMVQARYGPYGYIGE